MRRCLLGREHPVPALLCSGTTLQLLTTPTTPTSTSQADRCHQLLAASSGPSTKPDTQTTLACPLTQRQTPHSHIGSGIGNEQAVPLSPNNARPHIPSATVTKHSLSFALLQCQKHRTWLVVAPGLPSRRQQLQQPVVRGGC